MEFESVLSFSRVSLKFLRLCRKPQKNIIDNSHKKSSLIAQKKSLKSPMSRQYHTAYTLIFYKNILDRFWEKIRNFCKITITSYDTLEKLRPFPQKIHKFSIVKPKILISRSKIYEFSEEKFLIFTM